MGRYRDREWGKFSWTLDGDQSTCTDQDMKSQRADLQLFDSDFDLQSAVSRNKCVLIAALQTDESVPTGFLESTVEWRNSRGT